MDILSQVISSMDRHMARQYKVFAGRKTDEENRMDFYLFDLLRHSSKEPDEDKIASKLYGERDKNAYYRLKNRLLQDLKMSVFVYRQQDNFNMNCHYLVALGHYFFDIHYYKVALNFFQKAEKRALTHEMYGLLDIIYSQMIKIARELDQLNSELYIRKRRDNRRLLERLSETEDLLETLEYRVKKNQNLIKTNDDVNILLEEILKEYMIDKELQKSSKVQFGIYFIISRNLLQRDDYETLETYLNKTYKDFCEKDLFNRSNHQHKLQMLAWAANAAFKIKKYPLSLNYAKELHAEMLRYKSLHYKPFEFFYYNILVINYSAINPAKAVEMLEDLAGREDMKKTYPAFFTIHINLALLYFQASDFTKTIFYLNKLFTGWVYENIEPAVKLNMHIGELMTRFELKEYDFLEYRLKQIIKEDAEALNFMENIADKEFLDLFAEIVNDHTAIRKKRFRAKTAAYLDRNRDRFQSEPSLFAYDKWIKNKVSL